MEIVKALKGKIPGMVGEYASNAKIYRERGGTPKLEEVGASRIQYEDLPDMHRIETGEETKAVDLEAIIESYESDEKDHATYIVEGVPGPDGKERDLVLRNTYESGEIKALDTFDGDPAIHFYEAESGQLVNWVPKFMDTKKIDGDVHRDVENGNTDRYDLPDNVDSEEDRSKVGIRPYLIENKDERLNAWLDHLKRKFEKYEGGEGFWQKHTKIAILFAVGFSVAIIYYAVLGNLGDLVPLMSKLADVAPNTGFEQAAHQLANTAGQNAGGTPPGK